MPGLQQPEALLDGLTDDIVATVASDERVAPAALLLLLRRYASGARPDLAGPLGEAFARELDRQARSADEDDPAAWLAVFGEAAAASDDARLADAGGRLVPLVRRRWSAPTLRRRRRSPTRTGANPSPRTSRALPIPTGKRRPSLMTRRAT